MLTKPVDTLDRRGEDQIREVELKLNPDLKSTLMELCCDPKTTIVVLSGSKKIVLDNVIPCQHLFYLLFAFCYYHVDASEYICRISVNTKCGWQPRMGFFCGLQRENG